MLDLASIASLFFEASTHWTDPNVARFDRLEDADREPVVKKLKAAGHVLGFAREMRLRKLKREGWDVVKEYDVIGRPTIVASRSGGLILLHRSEPA